MKRLLNTCFRRILFALVVAGATLVGLVTVDGFRKPFCSPQAAKVVRAKKALAGLIASHDPYPNIQYDPPAETAMHFPRVNKKSHRRGKHLSAKAHSKKHSRVAKHSRHKSRVAKHKRHSSKKLAHHKKRRRSSKLAASHKRRSKAYLEPNVISFE